jgi:hypothetical protein
MKSEINGYKLLNNPFLFPSYSTIRMKNVKMKKESIRHDFENIGHVNG